ncbi:MAG TPA: VWA domain-containing protein [Bacteroidales bacterium]
MFQFAHSELLYLLLVIPVIIILFWMLTGKKKKLLKEFGDQSLIQELMPERSKTRPVIKLIILLTALAFFIFGLAGPEFGSKLQEKKHRGVEIIIALDVSNSMLAEDIQPSRLERAKQAISKMVDQLENDRIGLIVFAGKAYTQLPITSDYISAKMFLSSISTNSVPVQGTAIGAAISLADRSFTPDYKGDKAIILITDGENHEDDAVAAAKAAADKGIIVHTIGVGLPEGAPIPIEGPNGQKNYIKDAQGNVVISKLDEQMLNEISSAGNGIYVRATNTQLGLNTIFDRIKKMSKAEYESKVYAEFENQFQWPMGMALFLLLFELIILERKTKLSDKLQLFKA